MLVVGVVAVAMVASSSWRRSNLSGAPADGGGAEFPVGHLRSHNVHMHDEAIRHTCGNRAMALATTLNGCISFAP